MRLEAPTISRWALVMSGAILATGASMHGLAYRKASAIAEQSTLPPFFQAAFKGLWLGDSLSFLTLALVLVCIAASPRLASTPLILLLALVPLGCAVSMFSTMGGFFGAYVMLVAAAAAFLAAALRPRSRSIGNATSQSG